MDAIIPRIPISEKLIVGGDLNNHIDRTLITTQGYFEYIVRNEEGGTILGFAAPIANTCFEEENT